MTTIAIPAQGEEMKDKITKDGRLNLRVERGDLESLKNLFGERHVSQRIRDCIKDLVRREQAKKKSAHGLRSHR